MKKIFILILTIVSSAASYGQDINFSWAKQLGREAVQAVDEAYFIGTDAAKNVYVAGNFRNTIDLDPGPSNYNVTALHDNIFICKLDPSGNFIWGKQLGSGAGLAICKSVSVDENGNVYTTGNFSGTADFDPDAAVFNLTADANINPDNKDIFILKLNTNGDFQWAKQVGGVGTDLATSIDADVFGHVYITGSFTGLIDIDPGTSAHLMGSRDVVTAFIIKLDAAGDFEYGKIFETNRNSVVEFIRTDRQGNVYVTGHYNGTVDLDPSEKVLSFTAGFNSQNTFLVKLDPSGNFLWVQQGIIGYDIAVDASQNVYTFDAQLSKYDSSGQAVWTKLMGGGPYSSYEHSDIRIDDSGNIFITGMFRYTQDFDPGPAVYNLTAGGSGFASDVFVCKLDTNGDFLWAKTFGGYEEDYATGLSIDNSGNVYTTGVFSHQVDFDPGPDVYNLTTPASGGIFIHKMSPCVKKAPNEINVRACESYTLNDITYDSSGTYTQITAGSEGCDSVITLNLVLTHVITNFSATACSNYHWQDKLLTVSGRYSDTLTSLNGCDSIINLDLIITDKLISSIDTTICKGQSYASHTAAGTYTDTFHTTNGCDSIVTTNLAVSEQPAPDLGSDTEICLGDSIIISPGNFTTYVWQDSSTGRQYVVKKSGTYSVSVSNACGVASAKTLVNEAPCKIYFPSAFTPNSDGRNEKFKILNGYDISGFHLSVYNRYGEKLFETKDNSFGWDGNYKGKLCEPAAYVWYCEFKEFGVLKKMKGTVLLLR